MKAFESATNLNYSKAADNCQSLGGELAQPTNELESSTIADLLKNLPSNITSTLFWIGPFSVLTTFEFFVLNKHSSIEKLIFCVCNNLRQKCIFYSPSRYVSLD